MYATYQVCWNRNTDNYNHFTDRIIRIQNSMNTQQNKTEEIITSPLDFSQDCSCFEALLNTPLKLYKSNCYYFQVGKFSLFSLFEEWFTPLSSVNCEKFAT